MDLLLKMNEYRREASWAVWEVDDTGKLTGDVKFPIDQARPVVHGSAIFVALNPGGDRLGEAAEDVPDWANFHSPESKHNDIFLAEHRCGGLT
jgi:hypothetical protein